MVFRPVKKNEKIDKNRPKNRTFDPHAAKAQTKNYGI
jgi:hypothetical protein